MQKPKFGSQSLSGIAHWQREIGTDNSIYAMGKRGNIITPHSVEIHRYSPANTNFTNPDVVASFNLKKTSYVHSFSITENYVIFICYNVILKPSLTCLMKNHFHGAECMEVLENEQADVFVINLKTGEVKEMTGDVLFSLHQINAYETNDGEEIVLDLSPTDELGLKEYPILEKMLNPPEHSDSEDTSTTGIHEVTRYRINIQTNEVSSETFPNLQKNTTLGKYVNRFDFGVINEAYRGKEVLITISKYPNKVKSIKLNSTVISLQIF